MGGEATKLQNLTSVPLISIACYHHEELTRTAFILSTSLQSRQDKYNQDIEVYDCHQCVSLSISAFCF